MLCINFAVISWLVDSDILLFTLRWYIEYIFFPQSEISWFLAQFRRQYHNFYITHSDTQRYQM